jgi:hypothetical protein
MRILGRNSNSLTAVLFVIRCPEWTYSIRFEPDNMTDDEWYYLNESENAVGPLTLREMHELAKRRCIGPETSVWTESLEGWCAANSLEEFLGVGLYAEPTVEGQDLTLMADVVPEQMHNSLIGSNPDDSDHSSHCASSEMASGGNQYEAGADVEFVVNRAALFQKRGTRSPDSLLTILRGWTGKLIAFASILFARIRTLSSFLIEFCHQQFQASPIRKFVQQQVRKLDESQRHEERTKKCPMCAEIVDYEARVCRFCRFDFVHGQYPYPHTHLTEAEKFRIVVHTCIMAIFVIIYSGIVVVAWYMMGFLWGLGLVVLGYFLARDLRRAEEERRFKRYLQRRE